MKPTTRAMFNAFVSGIALLSGIDAAQAHISFAVDPSVQQILIDKEKESHEFLNLINIVLVDEVKAEILGLTTSGRIASRTDTSGAGERTTKDIHDIGKRSYECKKTDFDTHLRWTTLDMWAKFADFQIRIQNHIYRQQALDRICIGFNGVSAAATTNIATNPLLQDVNKGWLQKLREEAPAQVLDEVPGGKVADKVTYGSDGDYATLDAVVYDAVENLLPPWAADSTELVCIVGRELLHDKYFDKVNKDERPTEELALNMIMATKRIGGLPAYRVPYFPSDKIFITTFSNLSIYEQEGTRRRHFLSNPKKDREEDYQSCNEAYVIEDTDFAALIENLVRRDKVVDEEGEG